MTEYIESYVHKGKIGVLVHLECTDDVTPRTNEFLNMAKDIAMHIAASKPESISASDLSPESRNKELQLYKTHFDKFDDEDRLIEIEKINQRINRELCLLEQPFIKDPELQVSEILDAISSNIGDKISIKRFTRWIISDY